MWRNLVLGTAAVGVLDIADAILFFSFWRDIRPIRILQSVAAGLIGRDAAYSGGTRTALLGLALHFCIAFVVVAVYHFAALRIRELRLRPLVLGGTYGLAVWAVMNFVVLPMSAAGAPNLSQWQVVANALFAHVFCVGIPTALSAPSRG